MISLLMDIDLNAIYVLRSKNEGERNMEHDHTSQTIVTSIDWSLPFTEMQLMWSLMALMAIHHIWMWRKRRCKCQ